jgi:hypothetical protein
VSFLQLLIVGCWFLMSGVSVGGSGLFLLLLSSIERGSGLFVVFLFLLYFLRIQCIGEFSAAVDCRVLVFNVGCVCRW